MPLPATPHKDRKEGRKEGSIAIFTSQSIIHKHNTQPIHNLRIIRQVA